MTRTELKNKLNEISNDYYIIVDVLYYKNKDSQMVVVVYETKSFSKSRLDSWSGSSIEKAIMRFMDESQANLMKMSGDEEPIDLTPRLDRL